MQGLGRHARLALQHPRRGGGGRQAHDEPPTRKFANMAQHGGLAGPGPALHADDPIRRQQDRPHRLFLSLREAGSRQMRRNRILDGKRHAVTDAGLHRGNHRALRFQRPVGHE